MTQCKPGFTEIELTALLRFPSWWEWARCILPKNSTVFGLSFWPFGLCAVRPQVVLIINLAVGCHYLLLEIVPKQVLVLCSELEQRHFSPVLEHFLFQSRIMRSIIARYLAFKITVLLTID